MPTPPFVPLVTAAIVSLGLVGSAGIVAHSIGQLRQADQTIQVTGSARKSIRADLGMWRGSISLKAASQTEAYQQLQTQKAAVLKFLTEEQKVPAAAITEGNLSTGTQMELLPNGQETGNIKAHIMTWTFEVRLKDVDAITRLAQSSGELIARNLAFSASPPEYLYTKLNELRIEMLAEATQDARTRAESITRSAGSKLGPVRSVRTGVFQITRPESTEVSDYGMYDTSSIEKDITAVLSLTFGVM